MTSSRNPLRAALFSAALLVIMPNALADPRDGEVAAQAEVIAAIQARLAELGFYRGRPDGIVGQMTREAIRRYERELGVEPTGMPSLAIYRRLREPASGEAASEEASRSEVAAGVEAPGAAAPGGAARGVVAEGVIAQGVAAAGETAAAGGSADAPEPRQISATAAALPIASRAGGAVGPAASPPDRARTAPTAETGRAAEAVMVAGASWRFADEGGAAFTLQLRPDGAIGGVPFGDSWTWKQDGDSVELRYANRLGRTVTRRGTLVTADSIAGTAASSAGGRWTWTAERLR